jgi:hypothetical protein
MKIRRNLRGWMDGQTDGRKDGQADMMRLIVTFYNFANAPKNV